MSEVPRNSPLGKLLEFAERMEAAPPITSSIADDLLLRLATIKANEGLSYEQLENECLSVVRSLERSLSAAELEIGRLKAILSDCQPAMRLIVHGGNRRRADLDKAEDALTRLNAALQQGEP